MTILDRINLCIPLVQSGDANAILLGRLECNAYIESCFQIFRVNIEMSDISASSHSYRGLRIIPVNMNSAFILANLLKEEYDPAIRI